VSFELECLIFLFVLCGVTISILAEHLVTRTAQSCMIVGAICMLISISLGITSVVLKHVLLSMVASTLSLASGLYRKIYLASYLPNL